MTEIANCRIETYERMWVGSLQKNNRLFMERIIFKGLFDMMCAKKVHIYPPATISEPRYTSAVRRAAHS